MPAADDPLEAHNVDSNRHHFNPSSPPLLPITQSSPPLTPSRRPSAPALNRQRTDLEETFGESFDDDDDDDDNHDESHRLLPSRTALPQPPASTTSASSSSSSSNLVPPTVHHRPRSTSRPAVLPVTNDGVFSNMAAKPDTEADKLDETPPVRPSMPIT